eukprot:SAG11_NODE_24894_length_366_cov_1.247191_1_plen_63_part_01
MILGRIIAPVGCLHRVLVHAFGAQSWRPSYLKRGRSMIPLVLVLFRKYFYYYTWGSRSHFFGK